MLLTALGFIISMMMSLVVLGANGSIPIGLNPVDSLQFLFQEFWESFGPLGLLVVSAFVGMILWFLADLLEITEPR